MDRGRGIPGRSLPAPINDAMRFINRESELRLLRELFESPNAEMLIVYGRRRRTSWNRS